MSVATELRRRLHGVAWRFYVVGYMGSRGGFVVGYTGRVAVSWS